MIAIILGLIVTLVGLVLIGLGLLLVVGKLCNNPLATFIVGLITGHALHQ